jgi:hypothetical protein
LAGDRQERSVNIEQTGQDKEYRQAGQDSSTVGWRQVGKVSYYRADRTGQIVQTGRTGQQHGWLGTGKNGQLI